MLDEFGSIARCAKWTDNVKLFIQTGIQVQVIFYGVAKVEDDRFGGSTTCRVASMGAAIAGSIW